MAVSAFSSNALGQTTWTWDGEGSDGNWGTGNNWAGNSAPSGDTGNNVLVFSGTNRTATTNNLNNWSLSMGRLEFASGAASFTLSGNTFGFRPFGGEQQILQNSTNTQTIAVNGFSFRSDSDSYIRLNAGDLVVSSPDMWIDMVNGAHRTLYVTGTSTNRQTLTLAGNVNRGNTESGDWDPDIVIQNNKRVLVTGSLKNGRGEDASVFIENGVLQFSGSGANGTMTGGSPVIGATHGSGNAALFLDTAGTTMTNLIRVRGGSDGRRTIGGLNTSGAVIYSGNMVVENAPANFDLAAATGGTVVFSGTRDFNAGMYVNRPDGATTYGGTVVLSNTTTSTGFTALEGGTLEFNNLNQLGTSHFEFNAASGDSGTLRYTGGSATNTRTLWIDNSGITRAAIDVAEAGTSLTWNPGDGNINQNLTKTGAGTLVLGGNRITGSATVRVESGNLVLTGNNTYSGGTTVAGGRLAINGDNSAATGVVTVGNGATLGGSGTVGGQIIVSSGGTLAPGNSPGLMTATNGVSLATGSTFQWELIGNTVDGRGTNYDAVNVTGGTLFIGAGVTSSLVFNTSGSSVSWGDTFWNEDRSWLVFDNANTPTIFDGSVFGTISLTPDINNLQLSGVRPGATFSWNQQGNDIYLNYTAVPEPSTYALLALAAAGLGAHVLRRRK